MPDHYPSNVLLGELLRQFRTFLADVFVHAEGTESEKK